MMIDWTGRLASEQPPAAVDGARINVDATQGEEYSYRSSYFVIFRIRDIFIRI